MITESAYWRERLSRTAAEVRRRQALKRFSERSLVALEQDLMTGAFAVRKMVDSNKVPDSVAATRVSVVAYPSIGTPITMLSRWYPAEHYDFDAPRRRSVTIRQLCNSLIHSYVYQAQFDERQRALESILLNSDLLRSSELWEVKIDAVATIFERVATAWPVSMAMQFDQTRNDYRIQLA